MSKVFKPNPAGFNELRRSPGVKSLINEYANDCLGRLGEGFVSEERNYESRYGVVIYADTHAAWRKVIRDNVLLKVIGGG